jgi:hypothetical protein
MIALQTVSGDWQRMPEWRKETLAGKIKLTRMDRKRGFYISIVMNHQQG